MRSLVGSIVEPKVTNLLASPPPYVGRHTGAWVGRSIADPGNMEQQASAYGANGTLFGIVNRTSTATGAVGWGLYRKAKSGKKEDRTPVTAHAALDLWNKPNRFFTQRLFVETEQQHVDLCGEGDWVIARHSRSRIPLEMWPVQPHRIRPVPSREDYLAGWVYCGPDGEEVPLGIDEVIQIRMPNPNNVYRGLGPVQALMRTLDSQRYAEEWNRNFFVNNAEPGGIIEVEERLGDDEFNEFRDRWAESHQGISGAHRVAILENGMKWVERKYSMRDMQFAELAKVGDEKLFIAYGISKAMLGVTEDVNRANAEAGKVMFAEYLTVPRLDRFKDALNFQLLPMFGQTATDLEFDYDNPVPPDQEQENANAESKATTAETYIRAGFTGDSVKEALQLPEALVWEKPEPPAPPPGFGNDPKTAPEDRTVPALLARLVSNAAAEDSDLQQVQDDWEAALAALLAVWAGVTAAQRAELAAQVQALVDAGDVAGLAALTATSDQGAAVLTAALTAMASTAAATAAAEAAAQGVEVGAVGIAAGDLAVVAAAVAGLLAAGLATAAGKEAVRLFYPGASGEEVAQGVTQHLEGLSDAYLKEQLGGSLTRAQNVGRLTAFQAAEAVNPQVQYSASEVLDKNTCLAPEVRVTTRNGPVYAKDVTLDDELLTHAGRWVKPSRIVVSQVEEQLVRVDLGSRSLRLTWDHPVLVRAADGFAWRNAGELAVGDLVVDESTLQDGSEPIRVDLGFGETPDGVATQVEVGGLSPVDVRAQGVPVGAVSLNDHSPVNEEVDDPRADLRLGAVDVPQVFQHLADAPFDAGFGVAGAVAGDGAVALAGHARGDDAERVAAVVAVDDHGWTSADLRAVGPVLSAGVPEGGAAPCAGFVDATGQAARARAGFVPVGVGDGDAELAVADVAGLADAVVFAVSELGSEVRVGELALRRAVDGAGAVPVQDGPAADLAGRRRPSRVLAQPGGAHGTCLAERAEFDQRSAGSTRLVHDFILPVVVSGVDRESYVGEVYDFTVPGDETYWAEGVLVHNCTPCRHIDGTKFDAWINAWDAYAGGSYRGCLGGVRCRGTVVATWIGGA